MRTKKIFKVEVMNGSRKEAYNVVATDVSDAMSTLRWARTFEDYESPEAQAWAELVNSAVSVTCVMDNVIG